MEAELECPVDFDRLSILALRKYQQNFKLRMAGVDEPRPLITRKDLVKEVKRHFMQELKADGPELIAKFLALKKEEREHSHRLNR